MHQNVIELKQQQNRLMREFRMFKEEWFSFEQQKQGVQVEGREEIIDPHKKEETGTSKVSAFGAVHAEHEPNSTQNSDLNSLMITWDLKNQLNRMESASAKQS